MSDDTLPDPTAVAGMPHPRESHVLLGQGRAEHEFTDAAASGRMHSGWLLTGPQGIGKATFAYRAAAWLLAGAPTSGMDLPDDHPDLRLIRAGSHPRLLVIKRGPNEKGDRLESVITVRAMRQLGSFFGLSATDGGRRVVIVDAADDMNPNAANALLKLLEEPPAGAVLLLIAHQPARLLPTIRSRCRVLPLAPLTGDDLAAILQAEDGAALSALAQGSAGAAARIVAHDGLKLYADLVAVMDGMPRFDRPRATQLIASVTARGADGRLALLVDLIDLFLSRAARAGILGAPLPAASPHETAVLQRLAPHDGAARLFADLQQTLSAKLRQGLAVNLDPAMLILDTLLEIEGALRKLP
ncbi:DNA polymerase III subunit delta' [Ketogulonicigenium vulgare]|nr:DNA polymerase III subunit delta' [Ketogulonicigenium vulgare]ADO43534.1 DNA polymerase III subunit delta [Ketogulonicigenium vulgare Y25]ALJ81918.1 DNA polymerase III subunit delta' [Ketogulonicigenium vulgare]ANW34565.1 DNA polymerase III subunit delta' [Ketogulonicigenium vulgare]AOZ55569.1 DNA polymerase III subunit delta [Ketogulonicigenium vulgare]